VEIEQRLLDIATPRERELLQAIQLHGSGNAAAAALGLHRDAASDALRRVRKRSESKFASVPTAPPLPEPDIEIEDVIGMMRKRFVKRYEYTQAKRWREFTVPTSGPYALMLFGDPHIDDDGCNWELLHSHCELAARTRHLYAVSIGDVTNNWTGRLAQLYAQQETSVTTARKLIKWLMTESGVPWWLWIHGNHDAWSDGIPIIEGMNVNQIVMEDWQAKVTLASPNGHRLRLWATHNFKGHSMWNKLHGAQRAAQMSDWAHLYVAGHHHNWALHQEEHDERNFTYWLARVRGYKFIDSYADHHGFGHQHHAASVLAVVDPTADKLNALTCFADPFEGVEFLAWKRRKSAA
jgi:hypothetical protein